MNGSRIIFFQQIYECNYDFDYLYEVYIEVEFDFGEGWEINKMYASCSFLLSIV